MRVLSVIHGPAYGGAHNQAARLAPRLSERGIEILALLPEEASAAAERLRSEGVDADQIPLGRLRARVDPRLQARFIGSLRSDLRRIGEVIATRGIDVVQVHGVTNPQGALAAGRQPGVGVVWQLFDTRAPMPARRALMPLLRRRADAVTVWGRELARVHPGAERLGDRLTVVYPPVDLERFGPDDAARTAARERLGVGGGQVVLGTVGVINPQKGHDLLIDAAAQLADSRPELTTRVLGTRSAGHEAYDRSLHERAHGLGLDRGALEFVDPGADVATLLNGLDIFVMSSVPHSEGMPTAILEAMATGLPVVSTRVGAVAELVEDGVTGLLVRPDHEALAAAVERLLADPALAARMGEAGRRRALESFDLDRLADLHAGAYQAAARRARRRLSASS